MKALAWSCAVLAWAAASAQPLRIPDFRDDPKAVPAPKKAAEPCAECGVIRSIREMQTQRPVNVPQVFQNSPMDRGPGSTIYTGAVVYLPLGKGTDKPFVGGVGTPEMRERFSQTSYEVVVRLDTGGFVSVQRDDGASFRVGDRVKVQGNQLELLSN